MMRTLFGSSLILLGFASASFAVDFDARLEDKGHLLYGVRKLFGGVGQSQIYNTELAEYPKASIVHTYHHTPLDVPFSGRITKVTLPQSLENLVSTTFKGYTPVFSFVVQGMPEAIELAHQKASLKPQYLIHSDCPTRDNKTRAHNVRWTAIPGVEGKVEPEKGKGLLSDAVSSHPMGGRGPDSNLMILSGDVMHLKGVDRSKSTDFYDLFAFEDNGKKTVSITYRWMLTNRELDTFKDNHLINANTFRGLMAGLKTEKSFAARLRELNHYVTEPKPVAVKAPIPAAKAPVPAAKAPIPAVKAPIPAAKAPIPAVKAPVPAVKAPVPAVKAPVPAVKAPVPAVKAPVPAAKAPVPAAKAPIPAVKAPVPAAKAPIPAAKAPVVPAAKAPVVPAVKTPAKTVSKKPVVVKPKKPVVKKAAPKPKVQPKKPVVKKAAPKPKVQPKKPVVKKAPKPKIQPKRPVVKKKVNNKAKRIVKPKSKSVPIKRQRTVNRRRA